jgi:hypothetical protein
LQVDLPGAIHSSKQEARIWLLQEMAMRTQGQQNQKNPKWMLKEYTSEFILDGANQFAFTFPILMIALIKAFSGNYTLLIVYISLMALFFFAFFVVYSIKNGQLFSFLHKKTKPWAFRPLPQKAHTQNQSNFLKNYGFGSTSVFLTIALPMVYMGATVVHMYTTGLTDHKGAMAFLLVFIGVVGWDLVIYLFSIAAGMERQFNAWKLANVTRNMTSAQYADFQRDEYLAERGRAAGFNEGYMVGRNSRH